MYVGMGKLATSVTLNLYTCYYPYYRIYPYNGIRPLING